VAMLRGVSDNALVAAVDEDEEDFLVMVLVVVVEW